MTQRQIGEEIGYSQMHVSRVLRRSVTRLVEPFAV
jgi:DNA-directed RNA polymerase specialized sigma subunit